MGGHGRASISEDGEIPVSLAQASVASPAPVADCRAVCPVSVAIVFQPPEPLSVYTVIVVPLVTARRIVQLAKAGV
jgi:hypothetical protein